MPAVLWNRAYEARVRATRGSVELGIALVRQDGTTFTHKTRILPPTAAHAALNRKYVERLVKFLLWQKGGCTILVKGCDPVARMLATAYTEKGLRAFDRDLVGRRMFGQAIEVKAVRGKLPPSRETSQPLGRHLDGCRIGFDLGGSDRKCAAVVDGKVVFSDEVVWNPYFEKDPWYHFHGINDTLRRAAAHLPRIDAIGGSAAGVYVNNEPRVGSLYRGIAEPDFDRHIRGMFRALQSWWGGVPFDVVNDGEVTALAGSMSMKANAVLGYSMGTSVAAGYVTPDGNITSWLNELAFVPIDYRDDAPADEWSGDIGCGVQYFSQQAVSRLLPAAGIEVPAEMPLAERLVEVQKLMAQGDPRAPEDLRDDRHVLRLRDRPLRRVLRHREHAGAGPGHVGGGRGRHPRERPAGAEGRVPGARGEGPPPHAGREGQAARAGDRRGQPAGGVPAPAKEGRGAARARRS